MKPNHINLKDKEARLVGMLTIKKFKDGKLIWQSEPMKNKVVSSSGYGRNIIARQLANDTTYPIAITTARLGDGTTAPADSDTALANELVSGISVTNSTASNNLVNVDIFVTAGSLPNGTYKEFALYCGAQMFSRLLISPFYTKATNEDTLFTYQLTING